MTRPGTVVQLQNTPTSISVPTDTGTAFMAGLTDRGPSLTATLCESLDEFVSVYGTRQSYSVLYDCVDAFFREGGDKCYIGRVVGPGATYGSKNLLDGGAAISLVATALGQGSWSSSYKVAVVSGVGAGTYKIQVTDASNNVLEDSGDLATQLDAQHWSQNSDYIRITLGASANNPVNVAAAALSAGTDDRASIGDTQWANAIATFTADLGPGQVMAPGRTSTTGQQQLITHAEANNRVALIDLVDSATEATLEGAASALTDSRFAACFAPWVQIPGVSGSAANRTIPPSALVAGIIARNDPSLGPNRPSAGNAGVSRYAVGLSQAAWTDAQRQTMNTYGVNVIRNMFNSIRIYGWRSQANPTTDTTWIDFGNGRLYMAMSAELDAEAENFVFDEIDGLTGSTIGSFHHALAGVCLDHYNRGELFGDSADEAFSVDTTTPNTLSTIAANELHAVVAVRMSPMAEYVVINVVKVDASQVVS